MGAVVPHAEPAVFDQERGAKPGPGSDAKPGDKGYIGGLPKEEVRRIRAKARRYLDHHDEFLKDARRRMYEHTLKLEALVRYADDANQAASVAAAYRKAVADLIAAHAGGKAKAKR